MLDLLRTELAVYLRLEEPMEGLRTTLPALLDIDSATYHADLLDTDRPSLSASLIKPIDRFVDKLTIEASDCWTLSSSRFRTGYSQFRWYKEDGSAQNLGHRFAYVFFVGPIPDGLVLDHLCRNPACVNPAHLEPVTERENILRGVGPAAQNAAKTHCDYGHEFTPENTATYANGGRHCLACQTRRQHARRTGVHPLRDRTHCANGHEFTEANTHRCKNGWRKCRQCHAEQERARRAARKVAA